jgi:hypothetical protein
VPWGLVIRRPRDLTVPEDLVVVVAFLVTVVKAADRRVAPVHDAHAALGVQVGAAADQHLASFGPLLDDQPAEVGGAWVHGHGAGVAPVHHQALEPLHLLHQRRDVFQTGAADLIAQVEQARLVVGRGDTSRTL